MTRVTLSTSQLCDLLGVDPARFVCVVNGHWEKNPQGGQRFVQGIEIVLEDEACKPVKPSRS